VDPPKGIRRRYGQVPLSGFLGPATWHRRGNGTRSVGRSRWRTKGNLIRGESRKQVQTRQLRYVRDPRLQKAWVPNDDGQRHRPRHRDVQTVRIEQEIQSPRAVLTAARARRQDHDRRLLALKPVDRADPQRWQRLRQSTDL